MNGFLQTRVTLTLLAFLLKESISRFFTGYCLIWTTHSVWFCLLVTFSTVFHSCVFLGFWMQVRGTGPHYDCLPNDSDAPVGERIPHMVASIQSGNSAWNGLLCSQKGNSTVLDGLAFFFIFSLLFLSYAFPKCVYICFFYLNLFNYWLEAPCHQTDLSKGFLSLIV